MIKAYPNLEKDEKEDVFASGCGFYKLACLFFIGALSRRYYRDCFLSFFHGKMDEPQQCGIWAVQYCMGTWLRHAYLDLDNTGKKVTQDCFFAERLSAAPIEYICSVFTEIVFGTVILGLQ